MEPSSRISEYQEQLSNSCHEVEEWASDLVEQRPMEVMCGVFAAGFLLGVGLASTMLAPPPARSRSRFAQLDGFSDKIAESISRAIPKQVSDLWHRS
ncbi:hypothetical protein SH668x_000304 [Planctomicrobium sp. SH668]|uniref:hypothetical protein n=1 Tax=Planctomicrobium sp. SH668 TaxID=3448126 RepID=UPI003F5B8C5C